MLKESIEIELTEKGIKAIKGETNRGKRGFMEQMELIKNG